jgi:hypothetical protein
MKAKGDTDSIRTRFKEGPAQVEQALEGLTEADLDYVPVQGGWTIRQIVHHIADGDDLWKLCIKMALGIEQAEFSLSWYSALPQTGWAGSWGYANRSVRISLDLLQAVRSHLLELLDQRPDAWERTIRFRKPDGEFEHLTVGFIMEMQSDHVSHHIKRIREIRRERAA